MSKKKETSKKETSKKETSKSLEDYAQNINDSAKEFRKKGDKEGYDFAHRALNVAIDHIERKNRGKK